MKFFTFILTTYITKIYSYSCRSQNSQSCVTLDFPIDGTDEITNCNLLQSTFHNFVIEHNFFCNNMNQSYVESLCVNTDILLTDCFVPIGLSINTLYQKNNQICSLNTTIFDISVNSSIYTNISNYCNISIYQNGEFPGILIAGIIGVIFLGLICLICLCVNICPNHQDNIKPNLFIRESIV